MTPQISMVFVRSSLEGNCILTVYINLCKLRKGNAKATCAEGMDFFCTAGSLFPELIAREIEYFKALCRKLIVQSLQFIILRCKTASRCCVYYDLFSENIYKYFCDRLVYESSPSAHSFRSSSDTVPPRRFPSATSAPVSSRMRWAVLPISLPPEVQNGTIHFPLKS